MTERSSGTRYSRKNSGGTPPSKPYPLSQQLPDRGSEASKCRPTKLIPLPTSVTRRQRKQSFQMSSDKANSPSHVSDPQTEEAKASNVVHYQKNSLSQSPKKEGPAMITIKFNGKPTQIPTSTPITTFPHHPATTRSILLVRLNGHNPERLLPHHNPVTR